MSYARLRWLLSFDEAITRLDLDGQALWNACTKGHLLGSYLGWLGEKKGHDSPAHKRTVLIASLCARTASAWWNDPAFEHAVSLAEKWAWGDKTITSDQLRAAHLAVYNGKLGSWAISSAASAAAAAAYAAYASDVFSFEGASFAATSAADAYRYHHPTKPLSAFAAHQAALADLIRAAVPEVPL